MQIYNSGPLLKTFKFRSPVIYRVDCRLRFTISLGYTNTTEGIFSTIQPPVHRRRQPSNIYGNNKRKSIAKSIRTTCSNMQDLVTNACIRVPILQNGKSLKLDNYYYYLPLQIIRTSYQVSLCIITRITAMIKRNSNYNFMFI